MPYSKYDGTTCEDKTTLQNYTLQQVYIQNLLNPPKTKPKIQTNNPTLDKADELAEHSANYLKTAITTQTPQTNYIDTRTGKTYHTLTQLINTLTPTDLKQAQQQNKNIKTKLDYITHYARPLTKTPPEDLNLPLKPTPILTLKKHIHNIP